MDEPWEPRMAALRAVAELYGVETRHLDGFDREVRPSIEVLTAVLRALGAPLDAPEQAGAALRARRDELRRRLVEPVTVAWEGAPVVLRRGPGLVPGERVEFRVITEGGQAREGYVQVTEEGVPLAGRLPHGYHLAQVEGRGGSGECLVISAPARAFGSSDPESLAEVDESDGGRREWGVFLPLHALRSVRDRGTGDLTDLARLMDWAGELGGRAVGTLPLLAAFLDGPVEPSPYAPASRLFWNELFLDPTRLPEWAEAPAARELGRSEAFQTRLRRLREAGAVDFQEAYRVQTELLDPLARAWWDGPGRRSREFQAFVEARPDVEGYAAYRAALSRSGGRRDGWPAAWRAGSLPANALDREVYRRHLYAQFRMAQQMEALGAGGDGQRAGLYLDLPLGAHVLSWDVWANPGLFAPGPSLGAPPDGFHDEGQRWGLPPMRPEASRMEGHEHFRRILGHLLPHGRYLRIDHVMGLHRLYWVPRGASAREGAYVRYPAEELYAILCLESHRHRTIIVGEDLGTVPDRVRREMDRRGVRRMYVVPFELHPGTEGDEGTSPGESGTDSGGGGPGAETPGLRRVPRGAVASLNTHDLPTFAAAWNEEVLRRCLRAIARVYDTVAPRPDRGAGDEDAGGGDAGGEDPADEDAREEAGRAHDWPEALRVLRGVLRWLGLGPAGLVLVNLEDLWLEPRPQNVPGAADPLNWRRRARAPLERFTTDQRVLACLEALDEARARGRGPPPEPPSAPEIEPETHDESTWEAVVMPEPEPELETQPEPEAGPPREPAPDARVDSEAAPEPETPPVPVTGLGEEDLYLFNEGTHTRLYEKLGAHLTSLDGRDGTRFAVWAPNAEAVSVVGDFNGWDPGAHPLEPRADSGIWEGFVPEVEQGALYKYHIRSRHQGYQVQKADPFGVRHEEPPRTGSVVWDLDYQWGDADWMRERAARNAADAPISVYEVHLGSWRRDPAEPDRLRSYQEIAPELAAHAREMGFTHVELLPVTEHPFYGSWGYQTTGYFAPTARYGTPQDFMCLVDVLHQHGIGVILDWVPSHFPSDEHGLAFFDGTHLYEHADPRKGFHPDWDSLIFNYGRNEVRSFLLSSALFWLDRYHLDGLRVDAVASMLYLDYSRKEGEWIPNRHGGRENLEAIDFLRRLNEEVYAAHPDVQTVAEESTAWPMVSRPTYVGGLGFGMKWDMGWMHDTLEYMGRDPIHRRHHHDELTFRGVYAFNENFMLPLSHDEVVHGKGSLLGRMPGDDWQKRANLRLLFAYQFTQPGKKLLFMGGELAQPGEWNHDEGLPWHLLENPGHEGVRRLVRDLNGLVRSEPALHRGDFHPEGFRWIDTHDREKSVLSYMRRDPEGEGDVVVAVFNFTPVARYNYRVGVPGGGEWTEVLNTDAEGYGGSGVGNLGATVAHPVGAHGHYHSVVLALPPLGAVILKGREDGR